MEGEWQKMAEQGVNFQLNSLAEKPLQNTTTNLHFLPHCRALCCQELGQEDAPTCSSKVHQNAEIRGGDCGDIRKSHLAVVKSIFMCDENNGHGNCVHCATQLTQGDTFYVSKST
jgi:hypothetical protein